MLEAFFAGKLPDGSRPGVYIWKNEKGHFMFELRGMIDKKGIFPIDDNHEAAMFGLGPDDPDDESNGGLNCNKQDIIGPIRFPLTKMAPFN